MGKHTWHSARALPDGPPCTGPIIVPDVRQEPHYISVRPNIRSEMAVPMEDRGMVIGVVNVDSESVAFFEEHSLLTLLTNEASRVVSCLWLFKQLRPRQSVSHSSIWGAASPASWKLNVSLQPRA